MNNSEDLKYLLKAFVNEKATKTLLLYEGELVDKFVKIIGDQRTKVRSFKNFPVFVQNLYELEIERVNYILKEYLAVRIKKLRKNLYVKTDLLSDNEKIFYEKYISILKENEIYQECKVEIDENEIVGFCCEKGIGAIMFDNNVVDMIKDDIFVGPLKDIYKYIAKKDIYLI